MGNQPLQDDNILFLGNWQPAQQADVVSVIEQIKAHFAPDLFARLFTPLAIRRVNKDKVNPNPNGGVWYAQNISGNEVQFGNRVWFSGVQNVRGVYGRPFTTANLLMHEICHCINFRHDVTAYATVYQRRTHFGFVTASSLMAAETITDAFANYCSGTLKVTDVMEQVILPELTAGPIRQRPMSSAWQAEMDAARNMATE